MATLLRGRVLSFQRAPEHFDDLDAVLFIEDGGVLIEAGRISTVGEFADLEGQGEVIDHRPHFVHPLPRL